MHTKPLSLAWLSVLVCAAIGLCGGVLRPQESARWALVALILPAIWGYAELMQAGNRSREKETIMNWHRSVIAWAGLLLAVSGGSRLALVAGVLEPDQRPIVWQIKGILLGVGLAIWGNYLPKLLSPWELEDEPFNWQGVHRFCAWVASISGIAVVTVWLLLPPAEAKRAAAGIVVTFVVLSVGRKLISLATHSSPSPPVGPGDTPTVSF